MKNVTDMTRKASVLPVPYPELTSFYLLLSGFGMFFVFHILKGLI